MFWLMANNADAPLDLLWQEYSLAFREFDDLTLARWLAPRLVAGGARAAQGGIELGCFYRSMPLETLQPRLSEFRVVSLL